MSEATLLKGAPLAKVIKEQVAAESARFRQRGIVPRLAEVIASDDPSVTSYVQSKQKSAASLGIEVEVFNLGQTTQEQLDATIRQLADDPQVHGILIEFPLAAGLDANRALGLLPPHKDVDGLTAQNIGLASTGNESAALLSATAQACVELAEMQGALAGKLAGLVGRGRTVGRPLLAMLVNRHATVTVCHTKTPDLAAALRPCQVVFIAAGRANLIRGEHVQPGQIVIDAGINVVGDALVGDVEETSVKPKAAALTPVPGGVGTLTTAIIFRNLLRAIQLQRGER